MLARKPGMEKKADFGGGWYVEDVRWRAVWTGYLIGLLVTLALGLPLFLLAENSWVLAAAGLLGLLIGGFIGGRRVGARLAPINGALTGILYYSTTALAYFLGAFLELLPEPLPGLPQGDSTFFFAWPLAQLVFSVLGAVLGSRIRVKGVEKGV